MFDTIKGYSLHAFINKFNLEEKGRIHINLTKGPRETEAVSDLAISSLLLGKSPFDIILMDVTWLPKYAASGWLASLDQWIVKESWDKLASGAQLGNSYQKKIYLLQHIMVLLNL